MLTVQRGYSNAVGYHRCWQVWLEHAQALLRIGADAHNHTCRAVCAFLQPSGRTSRKRPYRVRPWAVRTNGALDRCESFAANGAYGSTTKQWTMSGMNSRSRRTRDRTKGLRIRIRAIRLNAIGSRKHGNLRHIDRRICRVAKYQYIIALRFKRGYHFKRVSSPSRSLLKLLYQTNDLHSQNAAFTRLFLRIAVNTSTATAPTGSRLYWREQHTHSSARRIFEAVNRGQGFRLKEPNRRKHQLARGSARLTRVGGD